MLNRGNYKCANSDSDHFVVKIKIKQDIQVEQKATSEVRKKCNVNKIKDEKIKREF